MDSWEVAKVDMRKVSNAEARELLHTWRGLTAKLAKKYFPHELGDMGVADMDDFLAIAQTALIESRAAYTPERGKFPTYAYLIIQRRLWEAARRLRGQTRADATTAASVVELEKRTKRRTSAKLRGLPEPEFKTPDPAVSEDALERLFERSVRRFVSLCEPLAGGLLAEDVIAAPSTVDATPETLAAFQEQNGRLWKAWLGLSPFERKVALETLRGSTSNETASRTKYSRQRVAQVKDLAMKKLLDAVKKFVGPEDEDEEDDELDDEGDVYVDDLLDPDLDDGEPDLEAAE